MSFQPDTRHDASGDAETPPRGLRAETVHGATERAAAEISRKAAEHLAGWQRARADYENLLRRTQQELARSAETAQDELLHGLLPIADYFSAAARNIPGSLTGDAWVKGILHIHQAFDGFLREAGITTEDATGIPFEATRHEAVAEVPSEQGPGTVVEVVARGYVRNGRILRPAKVKVSKGVAS